MASPTTRTPSPPPSPRYNSPHAKQTVTSPPTLAWTVFTSATNAKQKESELGNRKVQGRLATERGEAGGVADVPAPANAASGAVYSDGNAAGHHQYGYTAPACASATGPQYGTAPGVGGIGGAPKASAVQG